MTARAMTIAGSDSGGGAGIQADLKTFAALKVYGASAIAACTSQNTLGVTYVEQLSEESVRTQIDAVLDDIGADAVKTGMLYSKEIIAVVADRMKKYGIHNLVVDPVMVASTGAVLMKTEDISVLTKLLFPLAQVVTPNIPEAELLTGIKIDSRAAKEKACKTIVDMGAYSVVLKGGHEAEPADGKARDLWFDGRSMLEIEAPWVVTNNTHGTGCTFSAALAAYLARGYPLDDSIHRAKYYIYRAIKAGREQKIGSGAGPVDHFWKYANE